MTSMSIELCFCVAWAGSNKQIASSLLFRHNQDKVLISANALQRQVAGLVNAEPKCIKILLGSPAGPQLTPLRTSYSTFGSNGNFEDTKECKAMAAAWSSLKANRLVKVFVTQHSPATLGIQELVTSSSSSTAYKKLPEAIRSIPAVAVVALDLVWNYPLELPGELSRNKAFALYAMRRVKSPGTILKYFDHILHDDEEVVLAAVARNPDELFYASQQLRDSKGFVLKAVGVNGLCIIRAAPSLTQDKELALAAVSQNKQVVEYLCNELKEDKDIQQACTDDE